jgi:hypothetical protein
MDLDGLALVVVDRPGAQSCLGIRKVFAMRQSWW